MYQFMKLDLLNAINLVFRGDIHNDEEKLTNFTVGAIKHLLEVTPLNGGISRFFPTNFGN